MFAFWVAPTLQRGVDAKQRGMPQRERERARAREREFLHLRLDDNERETGTARERERMKAGPSQRGSGGVEEFMRPASSRLLASVSLDEFAAGAKREH